MRRLLTKNLRGFSMERMSVGNDRIDISNTCDWSGVRKATDASIKVMSEVDKL